MIDKRALLERIVADLEEKYANSKQFALGYLARANECEGRNQTRYDSMRMEESKVAEGMSKHAAAMAAQLGIARNYSFPEQNGKVAGGSLVKVDSPSGSVAYWLLPFWGGQEIDTEQGVVTVISVNSPIGKLMLGRNQDDIFFFRNQPYTIKDIS